MNEGCCPLDAKRKIGDRRFRGIFLDNPLRRLLFPPKKFLEGHVSKGMIVADLGCGPGYLCLPMAVDGGGRVYAVDFDEKQIVAVRKKAARNGLSNIEAHSGSASNLGFIPTASIDLVIAKGLLCCMLDHEGALREIHRIIKPGGTVYISVARFTGRNDQRRVGKEEWERILAQFRVQERGDGLTSRWAWVRKENAV
ncbi:MAG: class I SAM-dependent methyltransferase [Thaumarchaeota archaeon]|nr:class I SAM-dependent methyltransferase [Nitrososphaerota archaeon]